MLARAKMMLVGLALVAGALLNAGWPWGPE